MADRYWVGGTGTWNATAGAKWALTSGGTGGEAVPTSADDVYLDAASGVVAVSIGAASTCRNLTCTGFTGTLGGSSGLTVSGSLLLVAGMAFNFFGTVGFDSTTSQTVTLAGKSFGNGVTFDGVGGSWQLQDNFTNTDQTTLTNGTIDLNNHNLATAAFSSQNANTRVLAFGASGKFIITGTGSNWILATTTNLTATGTPVADFTYAGASAMTVRHGSTAGATASNAVSFNFQAGTYTLSYLSNAALNINFTGFAGTLTNAVNALYGSLTLSTGMTVGAGTGILSFKSTAAGRTITCAGKTLDFPIVFDGVAGGWSFSDTFAAGSTRSLTLTNGTLDGNGQNASLGTFALGVGTKTLTLGTGTWTVAGAGASAWDALTNVANLTVTASTGTISMTSASAKTFAGGAKTWPTLNQGGAGALTITGSNTFTTLRNSVNGATVTLTAATTSTVTNFLLGGLPGSLITLNSSSAGSAATLSVASGTVRVFNMSIQDSTATGGASFLALYSTDVSGNTGWVFASEGNSNAWPGGTAIRSFTGNGRL